MTDIQTKWLNKKIPDDTILAYTDKLKDSKRKKKCLIISGGHALQYLDYRRFIDDPNYDVITMNQSYLLPHAERATYHFSGAMGYIKSYANSSAFRYFCEGFTGEHVFVTHTRHCINAMYPVCKADIVRECIRANKIQKFRIITHHNAAATQRSGYAHIPNLNQFTPSKVPYGCGGTLNAMAMPFAVQLGYSMIVLAGLGDQDMRHFYDVSYIQPHLHKPFNHKLRQVMLNRWKKWRVLAAANNTKIVVIPEAKVETSIKNILITLPSGKVG